MTSPDYIDVGRFVHAVAQFQELTGKSFDELRAELVDALEGRGLPPDETLEAFREIDRRAKEG